MSSVSATSAADPVVDVLVRLMIEIRDSLDRIAAAVQALGTSQSD